ncbi:MAG: hypothetical protein HC850_05665 [Rhodomicrobium sp.]|nr:hypothetical protein [Rhodomicrobium sp.]
MSKVFKAAIFAASVFGVFFASQNVDAQQLNTNTAEAQPSSYQERKREMNENVVTIIASGTSSPFTIFAEDMQNVLDQSGTPGGLRVLPILGRGGGHNALDVLLLKGVDMGIMDPNDIEPLRKKEPGVFANAEERIQYITKLSNGEFQVLALKKYQTLGDLAGQKVNCFKKNSSTHLGCEKIFSALGVNAEIINLDQAEANEKLKSKEIAATVRFAGAPHNAFTGFKAEDDVHFIPITPDNVSPQGFNKLLAYYSPALLKNEYYPALIPADQPVRTITSATLLVTYNWPPNTERYQRVANFVNELFSNIEKFNAPGRHPKWKEINIAATVPGNWKRFKAAQDWLDKWKQAEKEATTDVRLAFDQFLKTRNGAAELPTEQREVLFSQFMQWWKNQKTSQR